MAYIIISVAVLLLTQSTIAQFNAGDNWPPLGVPFPNKDSIIANLDLPSIEDFKKIQNSGTTWNSDDTFPHKPDNFFPEIQNSTILNHIFVPHSPANDSFNFGIPPEVSTQNTAPLIKNELKNTVTENAWNFGGNPAFPGDQLATANSRKEIPATIDRWNLGNTRPLSDTPPHVANDNNYSFGIPLENSFLAMRLFKESFQGNPIVASGSFSKNPSITGTSLSSNLQLPSSNEREVKFSPISFFTKRDTASISPSSYDVPIVPWVHYLRSTSYGDPIIE